MENYRSILKELRDFVISETENQKFDLMRKWSRPLSERLTKGDAIAGLTVISTIYDGTIKLVCAKNDSRFREGDFLVLHKGNPTDNDALLVTIEDDDETEITVYLNDGDIYLLQESPNGWIADEGMLDLSGYYLEAIEQVGDTERGRETILPLLTGNIAPKIDFQAYQNAYDCALDADLNDKQSEAVGYAYSTDLVHLIQGPPGTGKTYVLAYLAKLFVKDGLRVFVTALTHRAINNALEKIYDLDPSLPVCKIGRSERAKGLKVPNFAGFFSSGFDDLAGGYIVGATPFAPRTSRLRNVEFDVVIFDEASQVTLPLALMGMLSAEKYIFIGDEHQLPPVTTTKSNQLSKYSIFEYLTGRGFDTMLNITYRLNRDLAVWPSRTFYGGQIISAPSAADRKFHLPKKSNSLEDILGPDPSILFIDLAHRDATVKCEEEAEIVCKIVSSLIEAELPPEEIGIVVPYRVQARMIRNGLRRLIGSSEKWKGLIVDTVERMQGQEREIVLISLTTSSPAFASQISDFFFQPQRINVAITRPRTKLIILGSRHVLNASSDNMEVNGWINIFKDLISSCQHVQLP